MKLFSVLLGLAALLLAPLSTSAQGLRVAWQQTYLKPAPSRSSYFDKLVLGTNGTITLSGTGSGNYYPGIFAQYDTAGTFRWQRDGRLLATGEQDLVPWRGGLVFAGSESLDREIPLLVQRLRPNGDTLPARRYLVPGTVRAATALVADASGLTAAGFNQTLPNEPQLFLQRTDTAGAVLWERTYPNPLPNGTVVSTCLLRTARGGYLLSATAQGPGFPGYAPHPFLLETDSLGRERRRRFVVAHDPNLFEHHQRLWGSLLATADGTGYVLNGYVQGAAGGWTGFVTRLDTALAPVWTRLLPPERSAELRIGQVRQLPTGELAVLAGEYAPNTPYLYVYTLAAATGQLLRRREVLVPGPRWLTPYDWQPVRGDSSFVVCGTAGYPDNTQRAWLARLEPAPRVLAGRPAAPGPAGVLALWPNPAGEWAQAARLAALLGAATLVLRDALGRAVRTWPLPAGAPAADVPLAGLPAGLYHVQLQAPDGRRWHARLLHHE
ncbi:hypothetical protein F0P96_14890 [Hymenobacter busanensis]|uniref:T9SS C-terminal target domain-containing protein n=1 Tax=Hymenobacter busanensis TaxID=2607656 RepID=A0AA88JZI8_9BACT|nr:hypothetical protein [Hymenobacter busanensis]KAA9331522.1 hypothetical protein F0P96_14890 [Hymenobacter busanensis]